MIRFMLPGLALLALLAVTWPADGGAAPADRCPYAGKRTVLETGHVSILARSTSAGTQFFECHRPSGTTETLNAPEFSETAFPPPALAVASTTVALPVDFEGNEDPENNGTSFAVDRYFEEGKAGHHAGWVTLWAQRACRGDLPSYCRVSRSVVRPNGSAAWISCPRRCSRSAVKTVFRYRNAVLSERGDSGEDGRELLDRGRGIDPTSLRRDGDRISWVQNGRRRSAAL